MIFVRSSCAREQVLLDEDFKSDGNLFSIPPKKVVKVIEIVRSVLAEYFEDDCFLKSSSASRKQSSRRTSLQILTEKIIELVEEGMKRWLQFAKIREIFKLLKGLQEKINFYQQYIKRLENIIGLRDQGIDDEEDEEELELKSILVKIDEKVKQRAQFYNGVSLAYDRQAQFPNSTSMVPSEANCPFKNNINHLKFQHETQILYCVHPSKTLQQQLSNQKTKQFNAHFLRNELYSNSYESDEDNILVKIENQVTSDKTHPTIYTPQMKKNFKINCGNLKGFISKDKSRGKSLNDSQFIEDLSRHVKPMPSALVNDSISDIIYNEEKEDRKKQTLIRRSIRGGEQTIRNDVACQDTLKKMKLHHKLRSLHPSRRKNLQTQPDRKERGRIKHNERKTGPGMMGKIINYFKQ